jgi:predicted DNA-binding transcriptional regulator AlpA
MTAEPAPATEPLLVDSRGLAKLLGVSERQLLRLRSSGRLGVKPLRLGRRCLRWDLEEVRLWIRRRGPDAEHWQELKGDGHG